MKAGVLELCGVDGCRCRTAEPYSQAFSPWSVNPSHMVDMVPTSHVAVSRSSIKIKVKMQFLYRTGHISDARSVPVADGCHLGQHRYSTEPRKFCGQHGCRRRPASPATPPHTRFHLTTFALLCCSCSWENVPLASVPGWPWSFRSGVRRHLLREASLPLPQPSESVPYPGHCSFTQCYFLQGPLLPLPLIPFVNVLVLVVSVRD